MSRNLCHRRSIGLIPKTRWTAYATAGAATAVAGINSAEADIHYSGPQNVSFNASAGASVTQKFHFDFATMTFVHQRNAQDAGFAGFYIFGLNSAQFRGQAFGNSRYPSNLGAGVNVSAGPFVANVAGSFATLAAQNGHIHSQWLNQGTGFIGFKFNSGSGVEYGWARVTMDEGAPGNSFTLVDYAWADSGTTIFTGQTAVPEPGTLGLLAVGAVGLLLWRRQRANASQ